MLISIVCCKCHTISFIGVWLQSDDCTWKKCVVVVFRHWIYANKCDYFVAHSADALRTKLSNFKNCQHHTTISISIQFTSIASVMNMEWFCWFVFFFDYFIRSSTRSFHFQFDASYYLLMWAAHTRTAIIVLLFYAEIAERCETCDDGLTFLMSNKFIGQTNNKYIYLRFEQWALTTVRHRW